VIVALSSAINLTNHPPKVPAPRNGTAFRANGKESGSSVPLPAIRRKQTLTFADRVAYQRAIEEVYWQHRIWPAASASPKPPLDKMMSQREIEKKVEDYLRNSQALEDYWQRPITSDQLQAEMERIASNTKQPGVLREIFAALGNDPFVVVECLARPVLAERLLTELYAHDHLPAESKAATCRPRLAMPIWASNKFSKGRRSISPLLSRRACRFIGHQMWRSPGTMSRAILWWRRLLLLSTSRGLRQTCTD
jgi:hypothetical protein